MSLYSYILKAKSENRKLLAILIDPDNVDYENLNQLATDINNSPATHILVGGSLVISNRIDELILAIKSISQLPIILFPGNPSQISNEADGILFLSLISGRNPDFLIGHHIASAPILKKSKLEIISTGYILVASGHKTAVERISQTQPLDRNDIDSVLATAQAGEMLGQKLIYLEAGSGAEMAVPLSMIQQVSENIGIPLIVGGGIRTVEGIREAHNAGADMVVIGTAFETNRHFFTS